jgi:hypothetical protein
MRALGFWLLVVRAAVVALFAVQLSSSGASAPRLKEGGQHAAVGLKASCVSACDHESHQAYLSGSDLLSVLGHVAVARCALPNAKYYIELTAHNDERGQLSTLTVTIDKPRGEA